MAADREPPPQVTMGLLNYITAFSLDEDYAQAADRRARQGRSRAVSPGTAAMVIVGLFGLLLATAAVQTSRNAVAVESGRDELITQIEARSARLDARRGRIVEMRRDIDALQSQYLETTGAGRTVSARLERLGTVTGRLPVTGPGVRIVVDDAPNATSVKEQVLDQDLQHLVNGLWLSGAEAMSVNGQRITNLSSIRLAGSAITVNNVSLSSPYVVSAIGNPNTLPARFVETEDGAEWLDLQATWGLQFHMESEENLRLPARTRLELRYATTPEDNTT